jgi:hypothetical protein
MVQPGVRQGSDGSAPHPARSTPEGDASPGHAPAAGRGAATGAAPSRLRWVGDAAVLFGLAGVAITQPVLDLFGRNPTFFVAGHYTTSQIILFAALTALVPATVVFVATTVPGLVVPRLAPALHGIGVVVFVTLFGLLLSQSVRLDEVVYVVPVVLAMAVAVALAERRWRLARQFLAYLAIGNLAFVVLFLTSSPTAELIGSSAAAGQEGTVEVPPLVGPVVLVVFDELPVTSIMRSDGTINDTRYPNLARLADGATWFRNAASESRTTFVSTPSILTGVRADDDDLPVLEEHPRNLFSLFGDRYPVNRFELVTDMCPEDVCDPPPPQPLRQLFDDASVVYRHRVLPPDLRDDLPPVDTAWGDFGEAVARAPIDMADASTPPTTRSRDPMAALEDIPDEDRGRGGQAAAFRRQAGLIDAEPSINFTHVALPHHPYLLTPWGDGLLPVTRLPDGVSHGANKLPATDDPAYDFMFRQLYPLQAMQIGALDSLVGEMIDHLEATGAWDDALVVVTSDHGIDMTAPGFTRREDDTNTDELFRIPLFIKAPGQAQGRVDDAPASTVDILPSMMDLLDVETDWELEGHSLFDGSQPTIDRHVTSDLEDAFAVAAAHEAQFPRGEDWVALAAVGEGEDLVGTPADRHRVGDASPLAWSLEHGDDLDDLSLADDRVPYIMDGTVTGSVDRPPELVVGVNGTLAGTIGGYLPADGGWHFTGYIAPFFEDGRNEVVAYQVERIGGAVVLHPVGD